MKKNTLSTLKIRTSVKAGVRGVLCQYCAANHNQTTVKAPRPLTIRTGVKSGGLPLNHNQTVAPAPKPAAQVKPLAVKTGVRAGGARLNHNQTVARAR